MPVCGKLDILVSTHCRIDVPNTALSERRSQIVCFGWGKEKVKFGKESKFYFTNMNMKTFLRHLLLASAVVSGEALLRGRALTYTQPVQPPPPGGIDDFTPSGLSPIDPTDNGPDPNADGGFGGTPLGPETGDGEEDPDVVDPAMLDGTTDDNVAGDDTIEPDSPYAGTDDPAAQDTGGTGVDPVDADNGDNGPPENEGGQDIDPSLADAANHEDAGSGGADGGYVAPDADAGDEPGDFSNPAAPDDGSDPFPNGGDAGAVAGPEDPDPVEGPNDPDAPIFDPADGPTGPVDLPDLEPNFNPAEEVVPDAPTAP